jgi:hypothetical protein
VQADRVQLQQVVLNLVMNGIDAMKAVTDRPRELLIKSQLHESGEVLVAVQDLGIGVDQQNMGRLFEPFYTTKPKGMGLGLRISRSIIEAHGGRLWATPNVGARRHCSIYFADRRSSPSIGERTVKFGFVNYSVLPPSDESAGAFGNTGWLRLHAASHAQEPERSLPADGLDQAIKVIPAGRRDVLTRIYPALLNLAGIGADAGQLIR